VHGAIHRGDRPLSRLRTCNHGTHHTTCNTQPATYNVHM
jgi:hypothetical protein